MHLRANVIPGSQNGSKIVEESQLDVTPPANYDSSMLQEEQKSHEEILIEAGIDQINKEEEVFNVN